MVLARVFWYAAFPVLVAPLRGQLARRGDAFLLRTYTGGQQEVTKQISTYQLFKIYLIDLLAKSSTYKLLVNPHNLAIFVPECWLRQRHCPPPAAAAGLSWLPHTC